MSQSKILPWKKSLESFIVQPTLTKWDKYFALANLSIVQGVKNYKSLIGLCLFHITCLIIFSHLWKIAAAKSGAVHLHPDHLLWYIALNEWVLISIPDIQLDMEHDLRSGRLAYLLPRPISYIGSKLSEGMGALLLNLFVLAVAGFTFTWAWVGELPFSTPIFCLSLFLGVLAGFTALVFQILIGLSAFWLRDVAPFDWVWEKLLFIFGGLILPLSVYPFWMQSIAHWTPFSSILGARSALALDVDIYQICWVTLSLVCWSLFGLGCITFCYRKGLRILNIEGG
jgi:ABC-2 type transport system permease protein